MVLSAVPLRDGGRKLPDDRHRELGGPCIHPNGYAGSLSRRPARPGGKTQARACRLPDADDRNRQVLRAAQDGVLAALRRLLEESWVLQAAGEL